MTSKNQKNKTEGSVSPLHRKATTKGQFRLQMVVLREATGASFKTNTLLAGTSHQNLY